MQKKMKDPANIPVLTDVVAETPEFPVLTEVVAEMLPAAPAPSEPAPSEPVPGPASRGDDDMQHLLDGLRPGLEAAFRKKLAAQLEQLRQNVVERAVRDFNSELPDLLAQHAAVPGAESRLAHCRLCRGSRRCRGV